MCSSVKIHSFSASGAIYWFSQKKMKKEIWQHALEVIRVVGFFNFSLP
jgi:hypothetical protein